MTSSCVVYNSCSYGSDKLVIDVHNSDLERLSLLHNVRILKLAEKNGSLSLFGSRVLLALVYKHYCTSNFIDLCIKRLFDTENSPSLEQSQVPELGGSEILNWYLNLNHTSFLNWNWRLEFDLEVCKFTYSSTGRTNRT